MRYYTLEKLINLSDGYKKVFKIDQHHLMLLQIESKHYVVESFCPHRGHPLTEADLNGATLRCPLHDYQFDIENGALLHATEEPCRGLKIYELAYEGTEVGVVL